ncbi:hypothetical protein [Mesoaciditoga sp.]
MLKTRNIAYGAMYASFSIVLLSISVSLADDPFTLMLASLPIAFIEDEFGFKTALFSFLTALFLTFAFFGLRQSVLGFALLFGPYTLIRGFVSKRTLRFVFLRWGILSLLGFGAYEVMNLVINIPQDYFKIMGILLLIASLFMYERLVEFAVRWHRNFFKRFSNMGR